MKLLHSLLPVILVTGLAVAQDAPSDPQKLPPPPWLKRAPAMSHWTITYTQASSTGSTTPDSGEDNVNGIKKRPPKLIEVTKTGKTIWEQTTSGTGLPIQKWLKDGHLLMKGSQGTDWFVGDVSTPESPFEQADYTTTDFAGFGWISASNFAGIQSIQGHKCLVFKDSVVALSSSDMTARMAQGQVKYNPSTGKTNFDKFKVDAEADIDFKTLLPINLKVGDFSRAYTYLPPPQTELDLPEDAQVALDRFLKGMATVGKMSPGRP